ncbi:MAG: hypothetical protein R3F08_04185 [Dokdonella sp.]
MARAEVGVWLLLDSYRLLLGGDSVRYGTLWSEVFSTLAPRRRSYRSQSAGQGPCRPAQRHLRFCGGAHPSTPQVPRCPCCPNPVSASAPRGGQGRQGWHTLIDGDARWPIFVLATDQGRALLRSEIREQTAALVRSAAPLPEVGLRCHAGRCSCSGCCWPADCGWSARLRRCSERIAGRSDLRFALGHHRLGQLLAGDLGFAPRRCRGLAEITIAAPNRV